MARDSLRGFLQLGFFVAAAGLCGAWFSPRESGEFVASICSAAVGIILIVGSVAIWRMTK